MECSNQTRRFSSVLEEFGKKRCTGIALTADEVANFLVSVIYEHLRGIVPDFQEPCPPRPSTTSVEAYVHEAFSKWTELCCPPNEQPVLVFDTFPRLPLMTNVPRNFSSKAPPCRTVVEEIVHLLPEGHGAVFFGKNPMESGHGRLDGRVCCPVAPASRSQQAD